MVLTCVVVSADGLRAEPPEEIRRTKTSWPLFRGDSQGTGLAATELSLPLKVRWKQTLPDAIGSTVAIVENVVYVGCDDGALRALQLSDGLTKWTYQTGGPVQASPTLVDATVLVGDDEGVLHAVNAGDGTKRWTFTTASQIFSSVNYARGRAVFGSYDGFVYCLDVTDGRLIWKFQTADRVHGTPALADGHLFAAGCDEYLHVLKLDDGSEFGKLSLHSVSGASAAVLGNRVFVGTYGAQVRCFDWRQQTPVWTFEDPDRQFPFLASAAISKDLIIVAGRDKRVRALHTDTGKQAWEFATDGRIDSSPVIVDAHVFVGSSDGNVYALERSTGKESWRYETGGPVTASPAVADGTLVIGNQDGALYCFESAANPAEKR